MLAALVPLFNGKMEVCAYSVFAQRENYLLNPSLLGSGALDTAATILGLEIINSMGIGTVAGEGEVFVEVNNISLFSDIEGSCTAPEEKIVLLLDHKIKPEKIYVKRIQELKERGYRFAIRKLKIEQFESYKMILNLMDYILLDHKKIKINVAKVYFGSVYPNIKLCAINVDSKEDFNRLTENEGYYLYEGDFFHTPIINEQNTIAPLKINYLHLLNVVNDKDFDLTKAADIISRDTSLILKLLETVNRMSRNSEITSVKNAVAMLGQKELKRWINTAVTREICADKPNEIIRLSLLRAKFAENVAPYFELGGFSEEIFLMGLFSVLDVILDKPMKEALELVNVPHAIREALLHNRGEFSVLLQFILRYEEANWNEVSRIMMLSGIRTEKVYEAYIAALEWYRDMFL